MGNKSDKPEQAPSPIEKQKENKKEVQPLQPSPVQPQQPSPVQPQHNTKKSKKQDNHEKTKLDIDVKKYEFVQEIIVKLKENQPQVWETEDFVEFLKQMPSLKDIAINFMKYEFDWKTFLKAKEEDFDAFIKKPDDKIELLQCRLCVKTYYDRLIADGATLKKKDSKKKKANNDNP